MSVRSKELEWAWRYWNCGGYHSIWNETKVWCNFRCCYAIRHFSNIHHVVTRHSDGQYYCDNFSTGTKWEEKEVVLSLGHVLNN